MVNNMANLSQQALSLKMSNQKNIHLTSARLEQWFASIASPNTTEKKSSALANKRLGQFGIKSTHDVIDYLKSPAGRAAKSILEAYLAELQAEKQENIKFELKNLARKRLQYLIYLLLGLLHKKEVNAKRLEEAYLQSEAEMQEIIRKNQENKPTTHDNIIDVDDEQSLEDYTASEDALQKTLEQTIDESESLELELQALLEELKEIDSRYSLYNDVLNGEDIQNALRDPTLVDNLLEKTNAQKSSYGTILAKLLNEGKEADVRNHLELTNALNLKHTLLNDIRLVHKQERLLFNKKGEQVDSFDKADFIVPNDKTLALENNQYYLHPRSKEFSKLTLEQKKSAQEDYQQSMHQIMGFKMQLELKQSKEMSMHKDKQAILAARNEAMQQRLHLLATQLTEVQSSRMQLENKMKAAPTTDLNNKPQNTQQAAPTNTPRPGVVLTKPQLEYDARNAIINRCVLHMENLMKNTLTSQTIASKQRLEQVQKIQQMQKQNTGMSGVMMSPRPSPTPFNLKPRP